MIDLTLGMRVRVKKDATGPAESYRGRAGSVEGIYPKEGLVDVRLDSGRLGLKMAFRPVNLEPESPKIAISAEEQAKKWPPPVTPIAPKITKPIRTSTIVRSEPGVEPLGIIRQRRENAPAKTNFTQNEFRYGDAVIVTNETSQFRGCRGTVREVTGARVKAEVFVGKHVCPVDFPKTSLRAAAAHLVEREDAVNAPRNS